MIIKPPIVRDDAIIWNHDSDSVLSSDTDSFMPSVASDEVLGLEEEDDNKNIVEDDPVSEITFFSDDINKILTVTILMIISLIYFDV